MPINNYINEIKNIYSPKPNEHSYRTPLENLFNHYKENKKILHEITTDEGYPDFTVLDQNDMLIGFIECKDIDFNIQSVISNKKIYKKEYE